MNMIFNPYIMFLLGLFFLIIGSEQVIENSKRIAAKFNIPKLIIGITIVALGTSFPELVVSVISSYKNQGDIAISNVIGSNIANIGLVLGLIVAIKPMDMIVNAKLCYNLIFLFISTLLLAIFTIYNYLGFIHGVFLFIVLIVYLFYLFKKFSRDEIKKEPSSDFKFIHISQLIIGFILIGIGSEYFINSIILISKNLGFINNIAISMSIVALGTSLPELMTSIMAIMKKEKGLVIGNIIGSNILNVFLVLGSAIIINPINLNFNLIKEHLLILFIITILLISILYVFKKLNRITGYIFICIYFIFIYINFFS